VPGTTLLARTGHSIGQLAFGCEQLGGYQWGDVEVAAVEEAIELAVAQGVILFDTADCYGRGLSETRLGRALAPHRDRVVVATKFGVRFRDDGHVFYDSSPQWAETALHDSLRRLGMSHVDLFQIHYWDGVTPLAATFERLEALRASGEIGAYGITNIAPDAAMLQYPGLSTVSLELSLANRNNEAAARAAERAGLTFIAYGSLGQGVLTGKYAADHHFDGDDRRARDAYVNFHGERYARNLRIVARLREYAEQLGASIPQVALAWILHCVPRSVALVGIKNVQQWRDACGASSVSLTAAMLEELERCSQ
jgi:aryl-alcohol dehydrogenase-like predicted oxidoreductase